MTELIIALIGSVFASQGFWVWINNRSNKSSARDEMLMGLGHDRIIHVGEGYLSRGWISPEEYDDLKSYLYDPYVKMGGNGSAKRLMDAVDRLDHSPNEGENE